MWAFIEKNRGTALFLSGILVSSLAWLWWVAGGGIAPFVTATSALNQERVSEALVTLPDTLEAMDDRLARIENERTDLTAAITQLSDQLDAMRSQSEEIVEWAPTHSQRLTDAANGCYAGETCTVYFRGRRTQAGAECRIVRGQPILILDEDREFPISFSETHELVQLTTRFETIPVSVELPSWLEPGVVGLLVMTFYAECPFATHGEIVERETFRLLVTIRER